MASVDFTHLHQFEHYAEQHFGFNLLVGGLSDGRLYPQIPGGAVTRSLLLGEVAHIPSLYQLATETQLPQWQHSVSYKHPISHDALGYAAERLDPQRVRGALAWVNRKLKRGKALEANKLQGLLVANVDANEQFKSYHRCCESCLRREVTSKDASGQEVTRTQYYHKQVYIQLCGPQLSVILDAEPMRAGEEECAAALRLLRRVRQKYGPRYFDVVVVDSWYVNGPFLQAVVQDLGWPVVGVLKQERYGVYQESLALSQGAPTQQVERGKRQVALWDIKELDFSEGYPEKVRVVRVRERWMGRQRLGKQWVRQVQEQHWMWVVAGDLDQFDAALIRDVGHWRWKIENNAFNELTQHWFLTHCAHHDPVATEALLLMKILAFTLFHAFAILHGKRYRLGLVTLQEQRQEIYRSLLCGPPLVLWSG